MEKTKKIINYFSYMALAIGILALIISITTPLQVGAAVNAESKAGILVAGQDVRKDPADKSAVLKTLAKNSFVHIAGKMTNGWYKVEYAKGKYGYTPSLYLAETSCEVGRTLSKQNIYATSTSKTIKSKLPKNTDVLLLGQASNGKYKIIYDGVKVGYIANAYIGITIYSGAGKLTAISAVRSGPYAKNTRILKILLKDKKVHILEKVANGWYKVEYAKGKYGYISPSAIKRVNSKIGALSKSQKLHSGPSTTKSSICSLPKDSRVLIVGTVANGWYEVIYDGVKIAYTSNDNMKDLAVDGKSRRQKVVAYLRSMATVEWKNETKFEFYRGKWYIAGKTYKGIPYSQGQRKANVEWFKTRGKYNNGALVVSLNKRDAYLGSDCSSSVSSALRSQNLIPPERLYSSSGFPRISQVKKLSAFSKLKPGDIICRPKTAKTSGHVSLVVKNDTVKKRVTTIDQSGYTGWSKNSTTTWIVNRVISYDKLASSIPYTLRGYND